MKFLKILTYGSVAFLLLFLYSCSDTLEPEVYSETSPDNLFKSLEGIESVLFSGYANLAENNGNTAANVLGIEESMGDNGYVVSSWTPTYQNYIMDPGSVHDWLYTRPYEAIRDANIILEEIENAPISDALITQIRAEATFIRAASYYNLFMRFGGVPLRTSSDDELELARSSADEIANFVESEFQASLSGLPEPGQESSYGRAHKGAAHGFLMKLYLNTKQWQKAADEAQAIMDMGVYGLFPDYFSMFFVANEGNEEMIWVKTGQKDTGRSAGNSFMNFAYPYAPSPFASHPRTGLVFPESARNFDDSNLFVFDSWYDTFEENDERKSLIITEYIGQDGELHNLANVDDENIGRRPFKYWPDDGAAGPGYGNDIPIIRYADVLLSRAEALNEINGPNQESVDLINQVRNRAGIGDLQLAEFSSKESLRNHILEERGWEFWWEAKRREDLIRHGKLIERAQERGLPAQPHHVHYPIPQSVMDSNPNLVQDSGY